MKSVTDEEEDEGGLTTCRGAECVLEEGGFSANEAAPSPPSSFPSAEGEPASSSTAAAPSCPAGLGSAAGGSWLGAPLAGD